MRVAAYIRVSTDEQADKGNSLSEQQERLTAYCVAMGWQKPTLYIDDGYSAGTLKRPAIKKLFKDVEKNKVDIVLTSKLDRFCRNLLDLLQTVEFLKTHNCNYVSASESFDTSTAVGRMVLQLLGVFAEFERERTRERVKDNMTSLAKNTDKAITQACYGYDIIDGKYVINDIEARNVEYIFDLVEEGHGSRMIAKMLNDRGVTTKRGKLWDQTNVKRLIKTETLSGTRIYNKRKTENGKVVMRPESEWIISENNHPAIIEPERFKRAQDILKARGRGRRHADGETYLLTGLVKCGHCGGNMKGQTSRNKNKYGEYTYYRYICSSYVSGYGCKYHAAHRDDIEKKVIDIIADIASSSNKKLKVKVVAKSSEEELKELELQMDRINQRMQRQIEAYENLLISADDLKRARERIDLEREELQRKIEETKENKKDSTKLVRAKTKRLLVDINSVDRLKSKIALRELIHRIILKDQLIDIVLND